MLTKKAIKALGKRYGFVPQKRLGQNFLIDENIKGKLLKCADINKDDVLMEIGSGLGQLTFELAGLAKKVVAIEFDKKLFSILSDIAKDFANVVLARDDFLKFNLKEILPHNKRLKVVSNLPYYISTAILLKLFAHKDCIDCAILTLQKEVAAKLVAVPHSKEYGSLTLFAEFHSKVERLFNISKNSFYPVPKVDSTVILLKMRDIPPVEVANKNDLFDLIRAGFSKRRKTLLNALLSEDFKGLSKEEIEKALEAARIPRNARAETLSLSDFARITNCLPT